MSNNDKYRAPELQQRADTTYMQKGADSNPDFEVDMSLGTYTKEIEQKIINDKHKLKYKETGTKRKCKLCGNEFKTLSRAQKFCSKTCQTEYTKIHRRERYRKHRLRFEPHRGRAGEVYLYFARKAVVIMIPALYAETADTCIDYLQKHISDITAADLYIFNIQVKEIMVKEQY